MVTPQRPLPSGFGRETTATEALGGRDLSGSVAVVTGGHSGLGLVVTRVLAEAGAEVVVPARDPERAERALAGIARARARPFDLVDPGSIDRFAESFLADGAPLHMLINNAAVLGHPDRRDARGFDHTFAVNHLGHFQLTARLWPALRRAEGARVVTVSSRGHRFATVELDDLHFDRREFDQTVAYAQSKTANALFALELDARGAPFGVRSFSVHPGVITTGLNRHLDEADRGAALAAYGPRRSAEQGAATTVWCAANRQLDGLGGVYCEDVDIASPVDASTTATPGARPWILDRELAGRLWTASELLTGVRFPVGHV
ncbi:SDR family NAD(P)-dependent oxidoreductase [Agromyces aerolatus]|uniref:SDR family NAD(P)-dependent oxidoreductase n=1 Tax=Agromyces sp. LY-1074 TaxID=3074080 RepID=UPI0028644277|nr:MULTISPECIES: SDR family NAD(P)-dependent oxidoreductase [unclassified Agromyces]MDR5699145.1 SDR family NAD(P)-dependent oxidoreductase [Agromyces sp. LY-1074]MDR5705076.1 SDR family NAD(P)-dependent oxidoreductase [Agromyces sp. LY-1358]